jgi:hypothetical protein
VVPGQCAPQGHDGQHDVAAGREIRIGGRAHPAVDVVTSTDLDGRPDERYGAARGNRVQEVDVTGAVEHPERAAVGVDGRDLEVALRPLDE